MLGKKSSAPVETAPPPASEAVKLEKQSMRNWYLLASFTALSTIGLLIAVTPVLSRSISSFWPSANTDVVLLVGLGGSILLLILQLTFQQIKVTGMRFQVQEIESEATETRQQTASRLHALLNVSRMMGSVTDPASVFQAITSYDVHKVIGDDNNVAAGLSFDRAGADTDAATDQGRPADADADADAGAGGDIRGGAERKGQTA